MRGGVLHHGLSVRRSRPLVVRGGLVRTFGGLASFLALTFLCSGIYILADAMANPIEAQPAAVIAGAFIIALATILLFYLIKPARRPKVSGFSPFPNAASLQQRPFFPRASLIRREEDHHRDLAYQRIYVDHSRIRPRGRV